MRAVSLYKVCRRTQQCLEGASDCWGNSFPQTILFFATPSYHRVISDLHSLKLRASHHIRCCWCVTWLAWLRNLSAGCASTIFRSENGRREFFFFNRWLHRISRILAVLGYEGIKKATPVVLHPKRKSSAHSL